MKNMEFDFSTTGRIIFGWGAAKRLPDLAREAGRYAFLVTGSSSRFPQLESALAEVQSNLKIFRIKGEPSIELVGEAVEKARGSDLVVGLGGGSVIDCAKAVAGLATNPGQPLDYLEVIGAGRPLEKAPLPYIAVPTTAGTGSEVTRNAVLHSHAHQVKVSLRSPLLLPAIALVDPELTCSVSPQITAATGLDALTQVIEPYVSRRANPLVDCLCREGIRRAARSLKQAFLHPGDREARSDMALASLFGGLALANAGLGAVHGLAAPIGGITGSAHGFICAALLGEVTRANVVALKRRTPDSPVLVRYQEVGQLLLDDDYASIEDGTEWIRETCRELSICGLAELGFTENDIQLVVEKGLKASSMKGNPIQLREDELFQVLMSSL